MQSYTASMHRSLPGFVCMMLSRFQGVRNSRPRPCLGRWRERGSQAGKSTTYSLGDHSSLRVDVGVPSLCLSHMLRYCMFSQPSRYRIDMRNAYLWRRYREFQRRTELTTQARVARFSTMLKPPTILANGCSRIFFRGTPCAMKGSSAMEISLVA
jgi:hypothetical protein